MGILDVPRGVTPRSGLLLGVNSVVSADTEVQGVRVRFDLGPGFCTGIHGWQMQQVEPFDTTADEFEMQLVLDPDIALTTLLSVTDPRVITRWQARFVTELTTSGATSSYSVDPAQYQPFQTLPLPLLTVRDLTFQVRNNIAGSTANSAVIRLLYSIYEVSDAEFVRIAGVSLARG